MLLLAFATVYGNDWSMFTVDGAPGLFVAPAGLSWPGPNRESVRLAPRRGGQRRLGYWGKLLHEEEVPRTGVDVTRRPMLARWHDGTWFAWTSRRKGNAAGEAASGLTYDAVRPTATWP